MRLVMSSTEEIVEVAPGVQARVWRGVTGRGVKCFAFVAALAVSDLDDCAEFERELKEREPFRFMGEQEDPEMDTIEARGGTRIYDGTEPAGVECDRCLGGGSLVNSDGGAPWTSLPLAELADAKPIQCPGCGGEGWVLP